MFIVLFTMALILVAPCCCENEEYISVPATAAVVSSVQDHFLNRCVYLLYTAQQTETSPSSTTLVKLLRLLSYDRIPAIEVPFESFNHTLTEFRCRNSHPLNVILSVDAQARKSLHRLAETTSLSGPTWLLILDHVTTRKEFLAGCNIPFDCEFLVAQRNGGGSIILNEVYNIATGTPLLTYYFGYWKSMENFRFTRLDFYHRRQSLQGLLISAATIENPPITVIERHGDQIKVRGYFGEVWSILEQQMNFTTNFSFPADGSRGSVLINGTSNGMIRMIQDKQVHVAVDAFGMSGIRAQAVDFTVPMLSTKYCVLIKSSDSLSLQWDNFLAPFSLMLWVAMVATVLVIAIHLTLLYYLGQRYGNQEAEEIKFYTFSDSLLLVLGIFCQQGHESTPRSYSCRFVCISTYIIAVMIFGTYSATFISFLAVNDNKLPYTDLKSLLVKGGYTFGMSSKHAENYISESSRKFLNSTFDESYQDNIQPSVLDGMQRVCTSKHSYLMPLDTALAFKNKVSCTVVPLPDETSLNIPQGIAITKNSPYRGLFNYNLNGLRANGVLYRHRIYDTTRSFSKEKRMWTKVSMEEVAPILGFLTAGIVAAVVVLMIERSTPMRMMLLQQRKGVFCCIAAIRYIDVQEEGPMTSNHVSVTNMPRVSASSHLEFPQRDARLMEENRVLTDIQQQGLSQVV